MERCCICGKYYIPTDLERRAYAETVYNWNCPACTETLVREEMLPFNMDYDMIGERNGKP